MDWIEELKSSQGSKVKLLSFEDDNHKHWGFITGGRYEIKERDNGDLAFFGDFVEGKTDYRPSNNWGGWKFVRDTSYQMENK